MGCRIISGYRGGPQEWAFGPVFRSTEEAEAFIDWLEADKSRWARYGSKPSTFDPRRYSDHDLQIRYAEFRKGWNEDTQEHAEQKERTTP